MEIITLDAIKHLVGYWGGDGMAKFPTINNFEYKEQLCFSMNLKDPVLQYEQKAWIISANERNNEPISWESGFIMDKGDNLFELVCTHNSGRLEWYRGRATEYADGVIQIEFRSVAIVNDDRMINSKRIYQFSTICIEYEQSMMTTKVSGNQTHLNAKLKR